MIAHGAIVARRMSGYGQESRLSHRRCLGGRIRGHDLLEQLSRAPRLALGFGQER